MSTTTTAMGLEVPVLGDPSGTYVDAIAQALQAIDAHDHSSGKGVQVPATGINVNADLPVNGHSLTGVRAVQVQEQDTLLSTPGDYGSVFSYNGKLYFLNTAGLLVELNGVATNVPTIILSVQDTISGTTSTRPTISHGPQPSGGIVPPFNINVTTLTIALLDPTNTGYAAVAAPSAGTLSVHLYDNSNALIFTQTWDSADALPGVPVSFDVSATAPLSANSYYELSASSSGLVDPNATNQYIYTLWGYR